MKGKAILVGGGRLKNVVSALIIGASGLGIIDGVSRIFTAIRQLDLAKTNIEVALNAFGLVPEAITNDLIWGKLMLPISSILMWLALLVIGASIYKSIEIGLSIEETKEPEKKEKKKEEKSKGQGAV